MHLQPFPLSYFFRLSLRVWVKGNDYFFMVQYFAKLPLNGASAKPEADMCLLLTAYLASHDGVSSLPESMAL